MCSQLTQGITVLKVFGIKAHDKLKQYLNWPIPYWFTPLGLVILFGFWELFTIAFSVTGNKPNLETIAYIATTVIAVCALALSIWQGVNIRTHNKLSFRPHLSIWQEGASIEYDFSISIENNGTGPAMFTDYIVNLDGKKQQGDSHEHLTNIFRNIFPGFEYDLNTSFYDNSYLMPSGTKQLLMAVKFNPERMPPMAFIDQMMDRIDITIKYNSLYNDAFQLDITELKTKYH